MGRPRKTTVENTPKEQTVQENPVERTVKKFGLVGANTMKDLIDTLNDFDVSKEDFIQIVYNSNTQQYYAVYEYEKTIKEDE